MRTDHRPYPLKRLDRALERWYVEHFIRPQLDHLGDHPKVMKPWNLKIHGRGVRMGRCVHVITASDRKVRLTTWAHEDGAGAIDIGDYSLICPGVRMDSALYDGYSIPPYYDSLIGKLIVHGRDRPEALARLGRALGELIVDGVDTTVPLFHALLAEEAIQTGDYNILWLEHWLEENLSG